MSLNPVQFGKTVVDQFGRYLSTTFPIADEGMSRQVNDALRHRVGQEPLLYRGPYVYLNRPFQQGPGIAELLAEPELGLHPALKSIFPYETLHKHQELALRAAKEGQNVILATGTGSGKTEAFLLPILDYCLRLRDQGADPGLAAIVVYPMNALVNDQLERLRRMLAGTGITFGRYTGETPAHKPDDVPQLEHSRPYTPEELEAAEKPEGQLPLPFEECYDRKSIRQRRPRILLTNYFQLEYMLLRDNDLDLFRAAPLRFLVMDEVHTYTGEVGSEVAALIRRLRAVTGKKPDELVCIGTSATISDPDQDAGDQEAAGTQQLDADDATRAFAHRLFGVPLSSIELVKEHFQKVELPEGAYLPPLPAEVRPVLEQVLQAAAQVQLRDAVGQIPSDLLQAAEALCGRRATQTGDIKERFYALLSQNRLIYILNYIFDRPRDWEEALPLYRSLAQRRKASDEELIAEMLAYLTLGALAESDGEPLLRPKLHYFIQGLSGLHLSFEAGNEKRVHFDAEVAQLNTDARVMPLRLCRSCGQHFVWLEVVDYFATQVDGAKNGYELTTLPDRFDPPQEGLIYLTDALHTEDEELADSERETALFCRFCGTVHPESTDRCLKPGCQREDGLIHLLEFRGQLKSCPACGAPSSGRRGTPAIRETQSSEVADITVLAQSMLAAMEERLLRKLLIFADNRQDAAFQAGWMEERAKRFRMRHLLYTLLHSAYNDGDPNIMGFERLAERLLEEAQMEQIVPSGTYDSDREETRIRWFLLEDFASTAQRRTSLEQLGLARVHYAGLEPERDPLFFQRWAERFGVAPEEVVAIVHTILDYYRRRGLLSEPLLARHWNYQDVEYRKGWIVTAEFYRPKGLVFETGTKSGYTMSWLASNGRSGPQTIVSKGIGQGQEHRDLFLEELWGWLREHDYLEPVELVRRFGGKVQPISAGETLQVSVDKAGFSETEQRYLCVRCQRAQPVMMATGNCPEYNCGGTLHLTGRDEDHYDVVQYTRLSFVPMRASEHSAQVPKKERERVESEFKRENGGINTIVATPTLELGVDIGKLEMTLMRNVPPTPANYAQRSGRAGRRHRIAVVFTYCRSQQHDRYFFADPPQMIDGTIRVPAFSMQNEPLIRKHVHSATLTALRRRATAKEQQILDDTFPTYIWAYFGEKVTDDAGNERMRYLQQPRSFTQFRQLVQKQRAYLLDWLQAIFTETWPEEDAFATEPEILGSYLDDMCDRLEEHTTRLFRQVQTYNQILRGYRDREDEGYALTKEERRRRSQFEFARNSLERHDIANYSLSYLANDGFLPGYALARESVVATSLDPYLEVTRPAATALRELTPANHVYANKRIFNVQTLNFIRFKAQDRDFDTQQLVRTLRYNPEIERVYDPALETTESALAGEVEVPSFPLTDVELEHHQEIDDRQNTRRRVAFNIQGMLLGAHGGGERGQFNQTEYQYLKKASVRLVNLGPARSGPASPNGYGFPICPQSGEMRSPFASTDEIRNFEDSRRKQFNTDIVWAGLHVEIPSDIIKLGPYEEPAEAANVAEALRIGARHVLDMGETEIESFTMAEANGTTWVVLYDPLPGGSGFLPQILHYWSSVCDHATQVLGTCTCQTACYRCMLHFRNQQWHSYLDRKRAIELLQQINAYASNKHTIPANVVAEPAPEYDTGSEGEDKFAETLQKRSFPLPPTSQYSVDLGNGSVTVADYAYPDEKILIFIDGLSRQIHGNPAQQRKDKLQRTKAKMLGYQVVELSVQDLKDDVSLSIALNELALYLGREDLVEG